MGNQALRVAELPVDMHHHRLVCGRPFGAIHKPKRCVGIACYQDSIAYKRAPTNEQDMPVALGGILHQLLGHGKKPAGQRQYMGKAGGK